MLIRQPLAPDLRELGEHHLVRRSEVSGVASVECGAEYLPGHHAKLLQVPVPVLAHPQVDLRDPVEPVTRVGVEQQPDLDAVPGRERYRLGKLPGHGVFAAKRLDDAGQLRAQRTEDRPGQQFGDPTAAGAVLGGLQPQRAPVEALHQVHVRFGEHRAEQRGHEPGTRLHQVGVQEHQHVPAGRGQGPPQHLALPRCGRFVQHVLMPHHARAGCLGNLNRPVGRPGVDDYHVVHQRPGMRQHGGHDVADRRLLVERGQHHRHRPAALGCYQLGHRPGRVLPGPAAQPVPSLTQHGAGYRRSMMVALAMPPPSHMVCRPQRAPRACMACTSVDMIRAPLAPSG
jgi:hypothetical protein